MNIQTKLENLGIKLIPINAKAIKMTMPSKDFSIEYCGQNPKMIEKISYNDEILKLGDSLSFEINLKSGNTIIRYNVNEIHEMPEENSFALYECTYNKATSFILPLIFLSRKLSSIIEEAKGGGYVGFLINCYVACDFIENKNKNSVFLLLKFSKSSRYKAQEDYFSNHDCFIKHYDHDGYVIFEFQIPDKYIPDYELILNGKYSEIKEETKHQILSFHAGSDNHAPVRIVLEKDQTVVKQMEKDLDVSMDGIELISKFDEKEVLSKSNL